MRRAVDPAGQARTRRPALRCPRSCASPRAKRHAAAEALRAPTIATHGRSSRPSSPLAISSGGASSSSASKPRIEPLPERQVARAERLDRARSRARRRLGCRARALARRRARARSGTAASAAARAAEARDQLAKGDRPDAGRADQPQPVDQVVGQAFALPMRGSVPALQPDGCSRGASTAPAARNRAALGTERRSPRTAAVTGALTAAAMPATDEIRIVSSRTSQTTA